ncbi:hypothetical protein BASA83_000336 [Batrachochytrium salamandrivorans]|nr:hypothetical protein BASA83_000336 [Batrachochytrium salamandrivorans]
MQAIHDYEDEENSEVVLAAVSPTVCTSARWVPAVAGSKLKADSIIFATEPVSAWSATDRIHHAPGSERGQERHLVAQIFILSKEHLLSEDEVREWTSVVLSNLAVHKVYVTGIDPAGQVRRSCHLSLKLHKNIMAYELEIGSISIRKMGGMCADDGFPANVIFGADRAEINAPVGLYV